MLLSPSTMSTSKLEQKRQRQQRSADRDHGECARHEIGVDHQGNPGKQCRLVVLAPAIGKVADADRAEQQGPHDVCRINQIKTPTGVSRNRHHLPKGQPGYHGPEPPAKVTVIPEMHQ